jgi:glycerol-3-phosphate acyltransferase PlsY
LIFNVVIAVVVGYLLGAIPFAYIAGRLKKRVDIRQVGGGNVGALNTLREIGLLAGITVLIADVAKGSLAVLIAIWLNLPLIWVLIVGFTAVVGHNWPVFLKFRGGKGAATTIGVLLALAPQETAISFAIMMVIVIFTSNFRLAIAIGLILLPLIIWQLDGSGTLIAYSLAISLFLLIRSLPITKATMSGTGEKKNLIFDKEHHFWQTRRSK